MKFPKHYEVEHGDSIQVEAYGPESVGEVELIVKDSGRDESTLLFVKPGKARKIARALLKAANVAEGKDENDGLTEPSGLKFPALLVDDDGDVWHLDDNGETYTYEGHEDGYATTTGQSYEDIAERWGIKTEARTR